MLISIQCHCKAALSPRLFVKESDSPYSSEDCTPSLNHGSFLGMGFVLPGSLIFPNQKLPVLAHHLMHVFRCSLGVSAHLKANYIVKVNYSFINIQEAFNKTVTCSDELIKIERVCVSVCVCVWRTSLKCYENRNISLMITKCIFLGHVKVLLEK